MILIIGNFGIAHILSFYSKNKQVESDAMAQYGWWFIRKVDDLLKGFLLNAQVSMKPIFCLSTYSGCKLYVSGQEQKSWPKVVAEIFQTNQPFYYTFINLIYRVKFLRWNWDILFMRNGCVEVRQIHIVPRLIIIGFSNLRLMIWTNEFYNNILIC